MDVSLKSCLRFCSSAPVDVMVPYAEVPEEEPKSMEPWAGEPTTIEALLACYNVECKIPGRVSGTTLYLVSAANRNTGKMDS